MYFLNCFGLINDIKKSQIFKKWTMETDNIFGILLVRKTFSDAIQAYRKFKEKLNS